MDRAHRQQSSSSGQLRANLCSRHNSPLSAYCCTDEQVICTSCATSEHRGHIIGLVREERRRKQEEVRKLKKKCKELLQPQEKQKAQVLDQIQEKASETVDFCEAVLTKIIDLLQSHYMTLRELVRAQQRSAVSTVQKQRMEEVKRRCTELDRLVRIDSDVHFLLEWPSVHQRCQRDLSDCTDSLLLPFQSLQDAVDSLGSRLQEFCNSGFASITKNDHQEVSTQSDNVQQMGRASDDEVHSTEMMADHHAQEPEEDSFDVYEVTCSEIQPADPQTREDFLQYACELTMDPYTAHEDLLLSKDLKEVRLSPQSIRGPAVRYPERFLHRRQLLCRESLEENCYYEIDVSGGSAEIALAYRSINRKSRFKQSAFGGNDNSWSLDCTSTHYSVSHRGDSVQLISVPEHGRIGVYLKFREGTVSFYEVSNTMKFLYMMEDSFNEPLYPGFWIGDNCRIRICDLRSQSQ